MNRYREQVLSAVEATRFRSRASYSWFGEKATQLLGHPRRATSRVTAQSYLLYSLQQQLYQDFYVHGVAMPANGQTPRRASGVVTPFVRELSSANCGKGYGDPGWTVQALERDRVVAARNGLRLWARFEDCQADTASTVVPGLEVSLHLPKERFGLSPGFYMAMGDLVLLENGPQGIVRFYWNVTPEGALSLMRSATSILNGANIAFQLKVFKDETRYERCDAAVLYVAAGDYGRVRDLLVSIYSDIADELKEGVPAFTKPLAKGLGLAEDPGSGESFGQHRCRLLAEALVRAHDLRLRTTEARLECVVERFREEGLSLDYPYLNTGSSDNYGFELKL